MKKKLEIDDFFNSMNREELNNFELYYLDYLKKTTNDDNLMTGQKYTPSELERLYKLCNRNLRKISLARR